MNLFELLFAYSDQHGRRVGVTALALAAVIAWLDWKIGPGISLGFLYIIPMLLVSALLAPAQILALSAVFSILREIFISTNWRPASILRVFVGWAAFALAGFFVSELNRKRRQVSQHLQEREEQIRLRMAAERQVRILIETSPLAIVTLEHSGRVLMANQSASVLLGFEGGKIEGLDIRPFVPILGRILDRTTELRTTVECKALRKDGDVFLAQIWLSSYSTADGTGVAAVIWDASENLRDREGTSLDSMMATSRVLIGAVSHEIRNLACAASAAHEALLGLAGAPRPEQTRALGSILQGLESIASSGFVVSADRTPVAAELGTVLDEARIVIEAGIREAGGSVNWKIAAGLPLVQADHHGLLQVFLNLARNSERAIGDAPRKELTVEASAEHDVVLVRFRDTGCGVSNPNELFRPFHKGAQATGLGLFISRAIVRAHGGDLRYEPGNPGSCFTVELWPVEQPAEP